MSDNKYHIEASISVGFKDKKEKTAAETTEHADIKLLEQKYHYMLRILDQEKERRKSVEHKASLFLTSNAIIGSLLVWSSRILFETSSIQSFIISIVLLVLIVLLARTIFFTLNAMKKKTYQALDEYDAKEYKTEKEFYENMSEKAERVIKYNQSVINQKVDNMDIAQSSYRYFWVMMVVYVLIVFAFQMFDAGSFIPRLSQVSVVNVLLFTIVFLVGMMLGNEKNSV